ncbi:MAG: hypothetical protein RIR43_1609 [Pseudomonadota bacterium]
MITLELMKSARNDKGQHPHGDPAATRGAPGTVMGWRLPGERLTRTGWLFVLAVFVLPVLALGLLLDAVVQWIWGWCLGIWCWF